MEALNADANTDERTAKMEMNTAKKRMDKTNEITDMLQKQANIELQKSISYNKGYIQACEDFGRKIREIIREEQGEAGFYEKQNAK